MTSTADSVRPVSGRAQSAVIAFIAIISIAPNLLRTGQATPPARPDAAIKLDPNRATREELMLLPGVGRVLADSIIDQRTAGGMDGFDSTEDLERVRRIGPKTIEKLRPYLNTVNERGGAAK